MNSDYRKIAEGMIEFTYGEYKHWEKGDDPFDLYDYQYYSIVQKVNDADRQISPQKGYGRC